jgi:hypothetical protein
MVKASIFSLRKRYSLLQKWRKDKKQYGSLTENSAPAIAEVCR